jgi:hypothetical protein
LTEPPRFAANRAYQQPEDELKIDSIGVALPLARICDRVELPPPEPESE